MNKPLTIVREDLKNELISSINSSNVPAFIAVDILEKLLTELRQIERQQYESDLKFYNESLKAEGELKNSDKELPQ